VFKLKKWTGIIPFIIIIIAISVILQEKGVSLSLRDISFMLRPVPEILYLAAALLSWWLFFKAQNSLFQMAGGGSNCACLSLAFQPIRSGNNQLLLSSQCWE